MEMELTISELVALAKTGSEIYVACVERGNKFKLIRNIKPTRVKLSYDFTREKQLSSSIYGSPNGLKYVIFKNLESKQNIEFESQKNYGETLHVFATRELAVEYYNAMIDKTIEAYNRDIEYLKSMVANIKKVK